MLRPVHLAADKNSADSLVHQLQGDVHVRRYRRPPYYGALSRSTPSKLGTELLIAKPVHLSGTVMKYRSMACKHKRHSHKRKGMARGVKAIKYVFDF